MDRDQEVEKQGGGGMEKEGEGEKTRIREKERGRHVLPVAATGVRSTIKNDETRSSDGANVERVRRCLRECSFVRRVVVYHETLAVLSDRTTCTRVIFRSV